MTNNIAQLIQSMQQLVALNNGTLNGGYLSVSSNARGNVLGNGPMRATNSGDMCKNTKTCGGTNSGTECWNMGNCGPCDVA